MPINSFLYPGAKVTSAFSVANSCRFGTDTYMDKDNSASSPTHADKYTISFWCKKAPKKYGETPLFNCNKI